MRRILEIASGIVSGAFIVGFAVMAEEKYDRNHREIERLKKRLDRIDRQLECIEVVEEED